ncbi:relaxase MobL [Intestinimonas butyriciproducens]|uniref:MobP3 family relaxase n=1 Tax=Intestinimonas butyriciproducens TaxID=1297617 RepID=UPI001D06D3A9|nr:MobP3 family relaxase [Intestinimonas butyriciproducens]MCB7051542.1 relaxase MobL [Intestinimonas butyriciproducens]
MPRIIFKCPYLKGGAKSASHLNNYVRYMATREGAQHLAPDLAQCPVTEPQKQLVERLLRDFPLSRGLFEYEDYVAAPTQGNASEFITRALEDNADQISKRENYVDYIASRPRAQRRGSHALFTDTDEPLVLSQIADAVAHHPGNIWLPIISLRREDAARLGYDDAAQWRELLTGFAPEMAEAMKIPVEQFRWYAAFHDEAHHPHLHMVCFSADGKSGYLNTDGIEKIKAGLAKEIFRQELHELYGQQTMRRNALTQDARELLRQITEQMQNGTLEDPKIEQLMGYLSDQLKTTKGKKQYGYLKAPLKSVVDEIVDELQKDERISQAYGLWYELRDEVLRTYRKDLPKRLPLSRQKEFRQIHNLVIQEAVRLGEIGTVFPPLEADEPVIPSPEWQTLTAVDTPPEQVQMLLEQLTQAAEAGQAPAQYTLGRLYRDGGSVEKNHLRSVIWLTQAAKQGDRCAMYALGKLYLEEDDLPTAMRWFQQSVELGYTLAQYRLGKLLLESGDADSNTAAVRWLTDAAECGDPYAQYALGKLYLLGKQVPPDHDAAVRWLKQSAAQGNESARTTLERMEHFRGPSVLSAATRLLHHMSRIFQEQSSSGPIASIRFTDSKLRQRIRDKKIAMGHKPDDHEDQEIRMS